MKKTYLPLVIIAVAILIAGTYMYVKTHVQPDAGIPQNITESDLPIITPPEGWQRSTSVQGGGHTGASVLGVSYTSPDTKATIDISADTYDKDIAEAGLVSKKNFSKASTKFSGIDGVIMEYDNTFEGQEYHYKKIQAHRNGINYAVTTAVLKSAESTYAPILDPILSSARIPR
ncbi:hypothetical protein KKD95_02530 [Patescibacteria group bacterium]|nr:hypothetical protein [Patescibacteria group bacterium]